MDRAAGLEAIAVRANPARCMHRNRAPLHGFMPNTMHIGLDLYLFLERNACKFLGNGLNTTCWNTATLRHRGWCIGRIKVFFDH